MAGQPNIRWRKSDQADLSRAVKNYNAKITRLAKKDPTAELPDKVSIRDIKAGIRTRGDYNAAIKDLRGFSAKGGEVTPSAKQPGGIRWRQSDEAELRRTVNNFNAKIRRAAKKMGKDAAALPKPVSFGKMQKRIQTRADYNREIDSLRAFSKKGAEELVEAPDNYNNLKLTKWQLEDMESRAEAINQRRQERREMIADIEITDRGEEVGYKKGDLGMGKLEERELEPINAFTHQMNRADLDKKHEVLRNESRELYWQERDELLRRNYIKSLTDHFRESDISGVIDTINNMPFDEFRKRFEAEGGNFELNYPKEPGTEEYQSYLRALQAIWTPDTGNS